MIFHYFGPDADPVFLQTLRMHGEPQSFNLPKSIVRISPIISIGRPLVFDVLDAQTLQTIKPYRTSQIQDLMKVRPGAWVITTSNSFYLLEKIPTAFH